MVDDLFNRIKSGSIVTVTDKKVTVEKREYKSGLTELTFKDCPRMQIHPDDSLMLRTLKTFLIENNITYGDVIGQEKISYSTFYAMERTKKVNVEIFERILKLLNYEIQEIKIGEKK